MSILDEHLRTNLVQFLLRIVYFTTLLVRVGGLGWPKISKILKSNSLTQFYENMDPPDEGNANRNVW